MYARLVPLAGIAALVAVGVARADGVATLKKSETWAACEAYFNAVQELKNEKRHYKLTDRSVAFLKKAETLRPASKREAFLFLECVNLANGNAQHAHRLIREEEVDDDKFFDMARIDATNNSNASQHRYMSKMDGKYNFELEIETAKAQFDAEMDAVRAAAMQFVIATYGVALATVGQYSASRTDYYNYNASSTYGQNLSNAFQSLAQSANQLYLASTGPAAGAPAAGGPGSRSNPNAVSGVSAAAAPGSFTAAPVAPPSAPPPSAAPPAGTLVKAPAPVDLPMDRNAPHVRASCADYALSGDGLVATVINRCDFPIEWRWCWVPFGEKSCEPGRLSGVIPPKGQAIVNGPGEGEEPKAVSVVCDMAEPGKFCRL